MRVFILWLGVILCPLAAASLPPTCARHYQPWHHNLDFDDIERKLRSEKVISVTPLVEALGGKADPFTVRHQAYFVQLETITAVFKPKDSSRSWGRVGAYQLSKNTHVRLISPTVMRGIFRYGTGSLQYFVDVRSQTKSHDPIIRGADFSKMPLKSRSDLTVFRVLAGMWNHPREGVLEDATRTPLLHNNGDILTLSQVQYGDYPYVARGSRNVAAPTRSGEAFPFSEFLEMERPINFRTLKQYFKLFWQDLSIEHFYNELTHGTFKGQLLRLIAHNYRLWVYWNPNYQRALYTDVYSRETLKHFRQLNPKSLREMLPSAFSEQHLKLILNRRDQILKAAKNGELID